MPDAITVSWYQGRNRVRNSPIEANAASLRLVRQRAPGPDEAAGPDADALGGVGGRSRASELIARPTAGLSRSRAISGPRRSWIEATARL